MPAGRVMQVIVLPLLVQESGMASDPSTGVHLIADADLDSLGLRLALSLQQSRPDPFRTIVIAVPTREMQTWVARRIAEVLGVCMNVEFVRLDAALLPDDARVWSAATVAVGILEALRTWETTRAPQWEAVKALLEPPPSTVDGRPLSAATAQPTAATSPSQRRRRARFALNMARRFLAYDESHPDVLALWEQGDDSRLPDALQWQPALWREVEARWQASPLRPCRFLSAVADNAAVDDLVVFGFARFSPRERAALQVVAADRRVDLFLHSLDDRLMDAASDTLGALWGAPLRETRTALQAMAASHAGSAAMAPAPRGGLDALRDVVFGVSPSVPIGDACIEVAAPGQRRSAEALASSVWDDLQQHPARRLTDVLVASGDYDTELVWLEDRLRALHRVPTNSGPGGRPSRLLDLVTALLKLGESECSRRQLVEVLEHPCFRGALPPRACGELAASVAVFFGVDGDDPALAYLQGARWGHWQQGLARLALGAVLGDDGENENEDDVLPPGQRETATTMVAWASSLLTDVRALAQQELSPTKWAEVLETFMRGYVHAVDDVDASHWMALVSRIRDLAELDCGEHTLDLPTVVELLRAGLDAAGGARGHFQAGGVSVTRLQLHRLVPTQVLMLSGLNEGRFPARDGRDPLDARRAMNLAFTTTRDLQAAAFLQGLCVARDRVLFVRSRLDTEKDAERAPSPLLADLRQHCVQAGVVLGLELPTLKAYEDDEKGHDLHARRAKDAARMRTAIDKAVLPAADGARPVLANFQRCLSTEALERAGLLTPTLPVLHGGVVTASAATTRQVTLHTLMSLLKYSNVETHAEQNLRMKGRNLKPDEAGLVDAEHTFVKDAQRWQWVKAVLSDALAKSPNAWPNETELRQSVAVLLAGEQAEGRAPPDGWLAPDVATDMLKRLDEIRGRLDGAGAFKLGYGGTVVYGAARSRVAGQRLVPALRVIVDGQPHDLVGDGPLHFGSREHALFVHVAFTPGKFPIDFHVQLALDGLGLLLAGLVDEGALVTGVFVTGTDKMPEVQLKMPSRTAALAWVAAVLRPLATPMPDSIITPELLPVSGGGALLEAAKGTPEERHARYERAVRAATPFGVERREEAERSGRALRELGGFQPPPEAVFFDIAVERFALLAEMGTFGPVGAATSDDDASEGIQGEAS